MPVVQQLVDRAAGLRGPLSQLMITQVGGTVARVDPDATAFSNRAAAFFYHSVPLGAALNGSGRGRRADRLGTVTVEGDAAFANGTYINSSGTYVNFLEDSAEGRLGEACHARAYERLVALKREFDPGNAFRLNQTIPPF